MHRTGFSTESQRGTYAAYQVNDSGAYKHPTAVVHTLTASGVLEGRSAGRIGYWSRYLLEIGKATAAWSTSQEVELLPFNAHNATPDDGIRGSAGDAM